MEYSDHSAGFDVGGREERREGTIYSHSLFHRRAFNIFTASCTDCQEDHLSGDIFFTFCARRDNSTVAADCQSIIHHFNRYNEVCPGGDDGQIGCSDRAHSSAAVPGRSQILPGAGGHRRPDPVQCLYGHCLLECQASRLEECGMEEVALVFPLSWLEEGQPRNGGDNAPAGGAPLDVLHRLHRPHYPLHQRRSSTDTRADRKGPSLSRRRFESYLGSIRSSLLRQLGADGAAFGSRQGIGRGRRGSGEGSHRAVST